MLLLRGYLKNNVIVPLDWMQALNLQNNLVQPLLESQPEPMNRF